MNLVWHRADLRLHDHPALIEALRSGPSLGMVVFDPNILQNSTPRRRAWFYQNTASLRQEYTQRGGTLLVRTGLPWEVLPQTVAELGVSRVFAVRNSTLYAKFRDSKVADALIGRVNWFSGQYVHEPGAIVKPDGNAYAIFTAYSRRWGAAARPALLEAPAQFPSLGLPPYYHLGSIPTENAGVTLPPAGEKAALAALESYLSNKLPSYHQTRDALAGDGGSRLSYYFNIGVLSPRLAVHRALQTEGEGARKWVNELCWRDFSGDLLHHNPQMMTTAFDHRWNNLPCHDDGELYDAWLHGQTGIPVVDACMRELQATGFLSNRGRMLAAQFAVKLALLPWQKCERAFHNLLLDGDNASNLQGWQWAGGLGVDAAPYFRVFNLIAQAQTHDPKGQWLRRWVPESQGRAQPYTPPVLDLEYARKRYLAAAKKIVNRSV